MGYWPFRRVMIIVAVTLGIFIAARLYLPTWTRNHLNSRLADMGDYSGHVESVDIHLWRGAYTIHALRIDKTAGDVPVPFFAAPAVDIRIEWGALMHGGIVGGAVFRSPVINLVDAAGEKGQQTGQGVSWREQLESLMPVRLDEVIVHDGTLHFRNFGSDPPVDFAVERIEGRILNLTNVRDEEVSSAAKIDVTARMLTSAPTEVHATFDPFAPLSSFKLALRIADIDVTQANDLLAAYAKLDVVSGTGEFVMELEARDKKLDGYAKPLFRDIRIFSVKQDLEQQGDNPFRALWEAVAGGITNIFKNQAEDQFATRIEIHGRTDNPQLSALEAIAAVLRNAFGEAFKAEFENLRTRPRSID